MNFEKEDLNNNEKRKISAGTVMCFRRKYKDEDGDQYEYKYEVSVSREGKINSDDPTWIRCESLKQAIAFDRLFNGQDKKVHVVKTWLPEGQRDEYV